MSFTNELGVELTHAQRLALTQIKLDLLKIFTCDPGQERVLKVEKTNILPDEIQITVLYIDQAQDEKMRQILYDNKMMSTMWTSGIHTVVGSGGTLTPNVSHTYCEFRVVPTKFNTLKENLSQYIETYIPTQSLAL